MAVGFGKIDVAWKDEVRVDGEARNTFDTDSRSSAEYNHRGRCAADSLSSLSFLRVQFP